EEEGARHGEQVGGGRPLLLVEDVLVEAREPEDDQEEDDEPRVVHRDSDASNSKQRDAAAAGHGTDARPRWVAFPHGHGSPSRALGPAGRRLDAWAARGALLERAQFPSARRAPRIALARLRASRCWRRPGARRGG